MRVELCYEYIESKTAAKSCLGTVCPVLGLPISSLCGRIHKQSYKSFVKKLD